MSSTSQKPLIRGLTYPDHVQNSLYSMFEYGMSRVGKNAEAYQYFSNKVTYGQLMDDIHACAAGLLELGVKKGDFVTICLPNIPQCVIAVYAVNRIGAVCNLVHPLSTKTEIEKAVNLTESRFAFTFELNEGHFDGLCKTLIRCKTSEYFPKNPKGFIMKTAYNFSVRKAKRTDGAVLWSSLISSGRKSLAKKPLPKNTVKPSDTAALMYTGGTTGDAKGVILTNEAFNFTTSSLVLMKIENQCHEGGAFLSILPVFHAFGMVASIHAPLSCGMRMVLSPRFDPKDCANLVLKEKIEIIAGVPAMYERMYPLLKGHDLSFVVHAVAGGDLVSSDLMKRYNEILDSSSGGASFLPGYGLTEACGPVCLASRSETELKEGALGKPLTGIEMCIVEPGTTKVIADTEEGELCFFGRSLMGGYYKNEKATADVMRKHKDGKTWLHTGDIVTLDEDRNIIFKSRYKRMVKVNGYNVYPTIIENTMEKCPLISEACAVAAPWKTDKKIKLYVTLSDKNADEEKAREEIMAYAKANLNHWSCPFAVAVLKEMPRTKMNKKDYKVLESSDE
ncbi:MAG TPA: class I adenylate-forming enzyme family protein [Methanocorpusculum sp.]|nr:class I adenylate-forming enzyme family protein [Methanocorpusculum sp.]